jgi:hypothetical protein
MAQFLFFSLFSPLPRFPNGSIREENRMSVAPANYPYPEADCHQPSHQPRSESSNKMNRMDSAYSDSGAHLERSRSQAFARGTSVEIGGNSSSAREETQWDEFFGPPVLRGTVPRPYAWIAARGQPIAARAAPTVQNPATAFNADNRGRAIGALSRGTGGNSKAQNDQQLYGGGNSSTEPTQPPIRPFVGRLPTLPGLLPDSPASVDSTHGRSNQPQHTHGTTATHSRIHFVARSESSSSSHAERAANPPPPPPPETRKLPDGWERRLDPRSGRVVYVDHANKRTQWTFPGDEDEEMTSIDQASPSRRENPMLLFQNQQRF